MYSALIAALTAINLQPYLSPKNVCIQLCLHDLFAAVTFNLTWWPWHMNFT